MTSTPAPDRYLASALLAITGLAVLVWVGAALAAILTGEAAPPIGDAVGAMVALPGHMGDPRRAWPPAIADDLPGPAGYWAATTAITVAATALGFPLVRRMWRGRGRHPFGVSPARLGQPPRQLLVGAPPPGQVTLGRRGRRLVAAEPQASLCVVGPTGCGKTAGLAIPALLEWDGPVLAASVKTDLLAHTLSRRSQVGHTWIYDPTGATGHPGHSWTPLWTSTTWAGAQRTAALLCDAARAGNDGVTDADYWYTQARKALAPHLYAAAVGDHTIADVLRWIDTEERGAIGAVLTSPDPDRQAAWRALLALWNKEDRVRSSVYATVENVLLAYADPGVQAAARPNSGVGRVDLARWLKGNNTLYLVAPTHEQSRLRPVLTALAQTAVRAAYDAANQSGDGRLKLPCLILLDEAGNTAPLPDLPAYAATARSHGITLIDIWQDLAQIDAIYGERCRTVINNHRALLFGRGITDTETLTRVSQLIGEAPEQRWQHSHDLAGGGRSIAEHTTWRPQAPADILRRLPRDRAVVVYGAEAAFDVALRPWYQQRTRTSMSQTAF